ADGYSRAAVSGGQQAGGFAGQLNASTISRCYSTGAVSGWSAVGGFLGLVSGGQVNYSYWDTQTSGPSSSSAGTGRTTEQMQQQAGYVGYNFKTLWQIDEGVDYPEFRDTGALSPDPLPEVLLDDLTGSGTSEAPYLVTTPAELNALRQDLAAHYRLDDDIAFPDDALLWDHGRGWTPIGTANDPFTGSLDGAGNTISNLHVNRAGSDHQGLFGFCAGASFTDLTLEEPSIHGRDHVGGLCGRAEDSDFVRTSVSSADNGPVISGRQNTGGLTGSAQDSSFADAAVTGQRVAGSSDYTGGLVGRIQGDSTIAGAVLTGQN
ncbi:GLUG motif-containing protein, partial [Desulfonatronum sp. SC1]|uniref:GLUG motif-containing protein n=1 Tax=Desulfonatronum sp. SC1 TaxID=2109626 RepID=UPI000D452B58